MDSDGDLATEHIQLRKDPNEGWKVLEQKIPVVVDKVETGGREVITKRDKLKDPVTNTNTLTNANGGGIIQGLKTPTSEDKVEKERD